MKFIDMTHVEENGNPIENSTQMISSANDFASVLQKSADLLTTLMKGDARAQATNNARISPERLRRVENLNWGSNIPLRDMVYRLADAIELTVRWTEKKRHRNGCPSTDEDFELRAVCEFGRNEEVGPTGTSDLKSANSKDSVEDSDIANEEEFDSEQDDDDEMKSDNGEEERQSNGTKKRFKCDQCNKSYTKRQTLEDHKRIHSSNIEERLPFKCDQCDKRFSYKHAVKKHIRTHLPDDHPMRKLFACKICGKRLSTSENLSNHERVHYENKDDLLPYKCNECDRKFRTVAPLRSHQRTHLPDDDLLMLKFECDVCDRSFNSAQGLEEHSRSHLQGDAAKPFKCDHCGKRFARARTLSVHTRIHLPIGDPRRTFECNICGKVLSQNGLAFHKRTQHLDENDPEQAKLKRPFVCTTCGKSFMSANNLKEHHLSFHSDVPRERPHACDICDKTFTNKRSLREHRETHLPPEEKEKVKCNDCDKTFLTKKQLKRHALSHLDDNDPENVKKKKPFECEICSMRFAERKTLKNHENFHTGNFPYVCDICGKGYNIQQLLKKHLEGHAKGHQLHVRKTKVCTLCPRRFKQLFELAQHMKRHEEGVVGDSTDSEDEVRTFECEICHKKYILYQTIAGHIREHHKNCLTDKKVKDLVISSNVEKVLKEKKRSKPEKTLLKRFLTTVDTEHSSEAKRSHSSHGDECGEEEERKLLDGTVLGAWSDEE